MAGIPGRGRMVVRRAAASSPTAARVVRFVLRGRDRLQQAWSVSDEPGLGAASPLAPFAGMLPTDLPRLVVVIAQHRLRNRVAPWLLDFAADDVHVIAGEVAPEWEAAGPALSVHIADTLGRENEILKALGPVDVILDLTAGPDADNHARWQRLFLHLRPGGIYVLGQTDPDRVGFDKPTRAWVSAVLDAADPVDDPPFKAREFAAATASVSTSRDVIVLQKQLRHLLKLRDAETNRLLPLRDPDLAMTELAALPAGEFTSRARAVMYEADVPLEPLPDRISYPVMHLRHFESQLAFHGGTLLCTERSILPESFRWHLAANPANPMTVNTSRDFARIAPGKQPRSTLPGNYYMVDPQYGGFGHIMTELVGRLWGWEQAKEQFPDLKAIFSVVRRTDKKPQPKHRVLRAYGIAEEDIVWIDRPVFLNSLVSPTSMWHNHAPYYVHPEITRIWDRLGDALIAPDAPRYERIFVSRSQRYQRRTCRNAQQVESVFAERGFTIVYPEDLDLSEQVGIFRAAKVIAGFGGSGLFNMMFAQNLQSMVILNHDSYQHRNEHLYTSLLGCDVHYFWSTADIPQTGRMPRLEATESNWEFDFARHGKQLEAVLDAL